MKIKSLIYFIFIISLILFASWTIVSSNPELKTEIGKYVADYGLENDRYEWGLSACDWILKDSPYNSGILERKVKLLMALDRYDEAYSIQKTLMADSGDITYSDWDTLGLLGVKTGDYEGAISAYEVALSKINEGVSEDSSAAASLEEKASLLIKLQRYDEAIEVYYSAIEKDPENASLWIDVGDAYLYKSLLAAGQIKDMYSSLNVRSSGSKKLSSKSFNMPSFESHKKAMEAYNKAVEINPTVYPLIAARILGNYEQTINSYQDILEGMNG